MGKYLLHDPTRSEEPQSQISSASSLCPSTESAEVAHTRFKHRESFPGVSSIHTDMDIKKSSVHLIEMSCN